MEWWNIQKVDPKNVRVCPHCGKKISLRRCMDYILLGTSHGIACNHCNRMVWLRHEPIPFFLCVCIGAMSIIFPMDFFLYYMEYGFLKSLAFSLPIALLVFIVVTVLYMRRIEFR